LNESTNPRIQQNLDLIKSGSDAQRTVAAKFFLKFYSDEGIQALIKALDDEFWKVRLFAARGLQRHDPQGFFERIPKLIRDENPKIRILAIRSLKGQVGPNEITLLRDQLKIEDNKDAKKNIMAILRDNTELTEQEKELVEIYIAEHNKTINQIIFWTVSFWIALILFIYSAIPLVLGGLMFSFGMFGGPIMRSINITMGIVDIIIACGLIALGIVILKTNAFMKKRINRRRGLKF